VQMGFSLVMDAMQTEFPNVPLLPAIGNHDNYLSDEMAPPPAGEAWLQVWQLFMPILSAAACFVVYCRRVAAILACVHKGGPAGRLILFRSGAAQAASHQLQQHLLRH
jgi:hypothetical protein